MTPTITRTAASIAIVAALALAGCSTDIGRLRR